jgi:predicted nucleic-acid-binding Zn-ribbon protein
VADCPKCGGAMLDGFIVDEGYGKFDRARWQEGQPTRSWWGSLKVRKKELIGVTTARCRRCGYLENYAKGDAGDV